MAGSGQRAHGEKSGGKRIDDHSFWAGSGNKDNVLPMGAKFKDEHGAEGAGSMTKYEDTSESIVSQQKMGIKKIHGHMQPAGHRQ